MRFKSAAGGIVVNRLILDPGFGQNSVTRHICCFNVQNKSPSTYTNRYRSTYSQILYHVFIYRLRVAASNLFTSLKYLAQRSLLLIRLSPLPQDTM